MGKRDVIQIDEDKIKRMIAGDLPKSPLHPVTATEENKKEDSVVPVEEKNDPVVASNELKETNSSLPRKRKPRFDYCKMFLEPQANNNRRQSSIQLSEKNYLDIIKILQVSNRLSISNFINNVLNYHFDEFNDDILQVRRNYITKLYEDE